MKGKMTRFGALAIGKGGTIEIGETGAYSDGFPTFLHGLRQFRATERFANLNEPLHLPAGRREV